MMISKLLILLREKLFKQKIQIMLKQIYQRVSIKMSQNEFFLLELLFPVQQPHKGYMKKIQVNFFTFIELA